MLLALLLVIDSDSDHVSRSSPCVAWFGRLRAPLPDLFHTNYTTPHLQPRSQLRALNDEPVQSSALARAEVVLQQPHQLAAPAAAQQQLQRECHREPGGYSPVPRRSRRYRLHQLQRWRPVHAAKPERQRGSAALLYGASGLPPPRQPGQHHRQCIFHSLDRYFPEYSQHGHECQFDGADCV